MSQLYLWSVIELIGQFYRCLLASEVTNYFKVITIIAKQKEPADKPMEVETYLHREKLL